ncbi:hypothetical protein MRX96_032726 [Rhipicephalus microplus]
MVWELDAVQESSFLGGRIAGNVLLRVVVATRPTAHFEVYREVRGESHSQKNHCWYSNQTQCLRKSRWQKICACRS